MNFKLGQTVYVVVAGVGDLYARKPRTIERIGRVNVTTDGMRFRKDTGRAAPGTNQTFTLELQPRWPWNAHNIPLATARKFWAEAHPDRADNPF